MLPRIIAALRLYAPHVQIELVSSNTVSNLLRREADIAVRMVRPEQAKLIARRIGSPLPERVTGSDLVPDVLAWARERG